MTKFYLVLYVFGRLAATIGNPSYSESDCERRLTEREAYIDRLYVEQDLAHSPDMMVDGRRVTRADVTLKCIPAEERPMMGDE